MTRKMQKIFYLFLLLFLNQEIFSQENLPTIKANSLNVDIRVDDDYFAKGGWTLDSTKKPDILSIGSKWLYEAKKVTFTTDIDSITVSIHPNSKYNFIILLNEKTPCYIQIATLSNPIFMNKTILIPLLLGLTMVFILLYNYKTRINTKRFLYFGYATPLLFWCMTLLSGAIHGNYNHFKNVISELGAIGTKSEILTSSVLIILALLCILFSIGFYRASRKFKLSVIPAILSFSMPITMIWAAIFTLGNEFHSLTGPLPFLIVLGFLLGYLWWKRNKELSELRNISLISFLICLDNLDYFNNILPFKKTKRSDVKNYEHTTWGFLYFYFGGRKPIEYL
jgi:hypothetical membrane protein